MPMTVKLKDIAEAANCSINTVSRALRDCSDIGAKTKRKIKDLAESMGYVPDNIAGYLRNKNTNLVGVVIFFHDQSVFYGVVELAVGAIIRSRLYSADYGLSQ